MSQNVLSWQHHFICLSVSHIHTHSRQSNNKAKVTAGFPSMRRPCADILDKQGGRGGEKKGKGKEEKGEHSNIVRFIGQREQIKQACKCLFYDCVHVWNEKHDISTAINLRSWHSHQNRSFRCSCASDVMHNL